MIKWLYLIQAITSHLFFYYGEGLFFYLEELDEYVSTNSLYSSGSDDDIAIVYYGVVCALSFLVLSFFKGGLKLVKWVVVTALFFQLFSLILIQMGSLWVSIFVMGDIFLSIMLLGQIYIFIIFWIKSVEDKAVL